MDNNRMITFRFRDGTQDKVSLKDNLEDTLKPGSFLIDEETKTLYLDTEKERIQLSGGQNSQIFGDLETNKHGTKCLIIESAKYDQNNNTCWYMAQASNEVKKYLIDKFDVPEDIGEIDFTPGNEPSLTLRTYYYSGSGENKKLTKEYAGDHALVKKITALRRMDINTIGIYVNKIRKTSSDEDLSSLSSDRLQSKENVNSWTLENNIYILNYLNTEDESDPEKEFNGAYSILRFSDYPEIGDHTINLSGFVAGGSNNQALGNNSFTAGSDNISNGSKAITLGNENYANYCGLAAGKKNKALEKYDIALGYSNIIKSYTGFAAGGYNEINASYGTALGTENKISGHKSTVLGHNNEVKGDHNIVEGHGNKISSKTFGSTILGENNLIGYEIKPKMVSVTEEGVIKDYYKYEIQEKDNTILQNTNVFGHNNNATCSFQTIVGQYNNDGSNEDTKEQMNDESLFVVGNGWPGLAAHTGSNTTDTPQQNWRHDAFRVLKNGTAELLGTGKEDSNSYIKYGTNETNDNSITTVGWVNNVFQPPKIFTITSWDNLNNKLEFVTYNARDLTKEGKDIDIQESLDVSSSIAGLYYMTIDNKAFQKTNNYYYNGYCYIYKTSNSEYSYFKQEEISTNPLTFENNDIIEYNLDSEQKSISSTIKDKSITNEKLTEEYALASELNNLIAYGSEEERQKNTTAKYFFVIEE